MNRYVVLLILGLLLMLMSSVSAQDGEPDGGTFLDWVAGASTTVAEREWHGSQIYCNDIVDCTSISVMFIDLLGIDPDVGWYVPNQHRALVEDWGFSNNNHIVTLNLREGLVWSDGTPITAHDVLMSYEIVSNPESNLHYDDGATLIRREIEAVELVDDYTLRVTLFTANCQALDTIADYLSVIPHHIYQQLIDEVGYAELRNHPYFDAPTVVSGPFVFGNMAADGTITLLRNDLYTDNELGYVSLDAIEQRIITTTTTFTEAARDAFSSGDLHILPVNPLSQELVAEMVAQGQAYITSTPQPSYGALWFNMADPMNPQPALDENGQRIDQGLHPIFSDVLVRQALAYAINVDEYITRTILGERAHIASHIIPTSWAYDPTLAPIPHDPDLALSLLADAGWIPQNAGEPLGADNLLVCNDCLYAREGDASFNGEAFQFDLMDAYIDRPQRGNEIASQLLRLGIVADVIEADLHTVIAQTYDSVLVGLNTGYPHNPDSSDIFGAASDIPDAATNFTSFYNEAYFALESTALTIPGCGLAERAAIYHQMQSIIQQEVPAIFLVSRTDEVAWHSNVIGPAPIPNNITWNIDTWRVIED